MLVHRPLTSTWPHSFCTQGSALERPSSCLGKCMAALERTSKEADSHATVLTANQPVVAEWGTTRTRAKICRKSS
ncbi:hypothetical protein WJX72_000271 [[Myrmecia] bisecta]|uniref:Uncharacterized protein n=1 Tax=[Myrmecia] bisecta TaxID=41462 RepID=A0AAW1PH99_9CHLO